MNRYLVLVILLWSIFFVLGVLSVLSFSQKRETLCACYMVPIVQISFYIHIIPLIIGIGMVAMEWIDVNWSANDMCGIVSRTIGSMCESFTCGTGTQRLAKNKRTNTVNLTHVWYCSYTCLKSAHSNFLGSCVQSQTLTMCDAHDIPTEAWCWRNQVPG